jgi:hypothetical protein
MGTLRCFSLTYTGVISMRSIVALVASLLLCVPLLAQVPVRHNIIKILDEVPAPPPTAKEAYGSLTVDETAQPPTVTGQTLFAPVETQLKAAEDAYKAQEATVKNAVPPGMTPDMARMAQDPEFKKKMKSMSKEERMKLAMSMMGSAPAPGTSVVKPEPPEIQAAFAEWQKLNADIQAEFNRAVTAQNAANAETEADAKAHDEIDAWAAAEIARLPQISSGEMSAPDPALAKAVLLRAADKHIALADKRLTALTKVWTAQRNHVRSRYGAFYAKLIFADYAAGSPNPSTQKILSDGQMTVLKEVTGVVQLARDAYESAARWIAHRRAIEKRS